MINFARIYKTLLELIPLIKMAEKNYYDTRHDKSPRACTIDSTISYKSHIDKICKRIASGNYASFELKPFLDKNLCTGRLIIPGTFTVLSLMQFLNIQYV